MASKKKAAESTSEEETEETTSEEESSEEEESSSEEEESSEEESEDSSEESEDSSEEEPEKPKAAAAPVAKKEEPAPVKAPKEKSARQQARAEEKKTISSSTHIGEDSVKTLVKKSGGGEITFEAWAPRGPFRADSGVEIKVKIHNESKKSVRSIKAWIRVFKGPKKGKGKKAKRPSPKLLPDSEQEYFQGARFPLAGFVSYEGTFTFPLPKKLEATTSTLEYELVLNFDVSGAIGWSKVQAFLPLPIRD
eukprot:TRINITY_DN3312_c0_g1_i1.p1 TRINITY_DN3312_c0_g1~~TRINITY_DN3312_c0_g1_i1.p1  ORF type:complete len:262 (+),score=80.08 TRINITY_DN3312_c0_g1_i1:38-787(+)